MIVQSRIFAQAHLKESRPKLKLSGSNNVDFVQQKRLLENALDVPSMTGRQKMQELPHYFDGAAFSMIEYCLHSDDADAAFDEAMEALKRKFGRKKETVLQTLEDALSRKALSENDADRLLTLFSKLHSKFHAAKAHGKASDFDTASHQQRHSAEIPLFEVKMGKKSGEVSERERGRIDVW